MFHFFLMKKDFARVVIGNERATWSARVLPNLYWQDVRHCKWPACNLPTQPMRNRAIRNAGIEDALEFCNRSFNFAGVP